MQLGKGDVLTIDMNSAAGTNGAGGEAAPLIELLKGEGFTSTMERRADGAWAVNFWRE